MKLLVVILNYRVTDLTLDCLRSLEGRIERMPATRVAVLEHGTGGDAYERLRTAIEANGWGRWADLSQVEVNRGFCGGNNLVIRAALASEDPPEYVLLLNADTLVGDGTLEKLVEFMDRTPRAGVAAGTIVGPDGVVHGAPFRFPGIASTIDNGLGLGLVSKLFKRWTVVDPKPVVDTRVDWIPGTCMILRRTMLEEIGLLDEGLYTYFDDIDICLRTRRAGWEAWFVPGSRVVHLEGMSTGVAARFQKRRPAYWFQARRRFFLKSHGALYTTLIDTAFLASLALGKLRRAIQGKPDPDPPHMLGDSFRNSVFCTGFQVREVQNPALLESQTASPST
ncbi:MAG: glycosyltransferase family 2 protein [Planctomycetes bacterium]|nr:glycosyltransferase family 2 protein [Planctomycetota bacterium]